jgi:hypothetical protein
MSTAVLVAQHTSQLWPTIGRALTTVGSIAAAVAAVYGTKNHRINQRLEVKVNGELHGHVTNLAATAKQLEIALARANTAEADLAAAQLAPAIPTALTANSDPKA